MMLKETLVAGALVLAACGSEVNDRPAEFDYIAVAVLRPACGTASCHSSLTKTAGFAFDTIEAARESMNKPRRKRLIVAGDPDKSELWQVLVGDSKRMPPDGPLPDKDLDLIETWILNGGATN